MHPGRSCRNLVTRFFKALIRDGFRCMVTRTLSDDFPELWCASNDPTQSLECCYVFPEGLGSCDAKDVASKASRPCDMFGCVLM